MLARSAFQSDDQMPEPWMTASGLTVLTRIPCGPPSSARQRARCSDAAFADEYAAAFAPATSAFFDADEDDRPAAPLREQDAERLARGEEVAACEHGVVLLPIRERRLGDRRARRETGRGDEDVDAAVLEHCPPRHLHDCLLARDVDGDRERAAKAVRRHELVGDLLDALDVAIGDDDVRAARSKHARSRAADSARTAGDQRDAPASSPRGGACASL